MRSIAQGQGSFLFPDDETPAEETKICKDCGLPKPLGDFYFKDKEKRWRHSRCKACFGILTYARSKADREKNPEKHTARVIAWQKANPEKVKESQRKSKKKNRPKSRETERAYKRANHDKIRAKKIRYKARHKDVIDAANARFRAANEERLREYHKAWRDAHPEQSRENLSRAKHKRRALLAGSGGDHTPEEWAAIKEAQGYMCLMCGRCEPEIKLTKDHVIPISKGGTNDAGNLQGLCRSCNSRKHAKLLVLPRKPADATPLPPLADDPVQSGIPGDLPSPEA